MKRYGSTATGGHHVPAKANYRSTVDYATYARNAPAIPINELANPNNPATGHVLHREITAAQQRKYDSSASAFDSVTDVYTWDCVREIEIRAHISVGYSSETAAAYVDFGIGQLKNQGILNPTNIPWSPSLI